MKFISLEPTNSLYRQAFRDYNILNYEVYVDENESVGRVVDVLSDEMQRSYYLAVEHRGLLSQKRFILPLTACQLAHSERRIYITELSKAQIKDLPAYRKENVIRYDNEPHVAQTTHQVTPAIETLPLEASRPLEHARPLEPTTGVVSAEIPRGTTYSTREMEHVDTNSHVSTESIVNGSPSQTNVVPKEEQIIQLLAERLVVGRRQRKVGEVVVRKVIETQMVEVPVRRERLIVEQVSPEHKQLAAIDLGRGELSQVELREMIPSLSDHEVRSVSDQALSAEQVVLSAETVSIHLALQILQQVKQAPQFKHTAVKLVFDDSELQERYQRWLAEYKA